MIVSLVVSSLVLMLGYCTASSWKAIARYPKLQAQTGEFHGHRPRHGHDASAVTALQGKKFRDFSTPASGILVDECFFRQSWRARGSDTRVAEYWDLRHGDYPGFAPRCSECSRRIIGWGSMGRAFRDCASGVAGMFGSLRAAGYSNIEASCTDVGAD